MFRRCSNNLSVDVRSCWFIFCFVCFLVCFVVENWCLVCMAMANGLARPVECLFRARANIHHRIPNSLWKRIIRIVQREFVARVFLRLTFLFSRYFGSECVWLSVLVSVTIIYFYCFSFVNGMVLVHVLFLFCLDRHVD